MFSKITLLHWQEDIFIFIDKFQDLKVITCEALCPDFPENVGKIGTIMKMDCCLFLFSFRCHLSCISGLTLISGSRSLGWENDTFLQQIVWLMKTILLKLTAGTIKDPKTYLLDLLQLRCLFLTFGQDCYNCSLSPEWATSKKPSDVWHGLFTNTAPVTTCQAICTICWAWITREGQVDSWSCHLWNATEERNIRNPIKRHTEYPRRARRDWWKYGGISDGGPIPGTLEPFSLSKIPFEG